MDDLNISLFISHTFNFMYATKTKNIIKSALNNVLTKNGGEGGRGGALLRMMGVSVTSLLRPSWLTSLITYYRLTYLKPSG